MRAVSVGEWGADRGIRVERNGKGGEGK